MQTLRILICTVVTVACLSGITGCWDEKPVEWRAVVASIGIDPTCQPGIERYTFTFPNVTLTTSSLSTTPANQEFYIITLRSRSLMSALSALEDRQSRSLYVGEVRVLVLSTRLAPHAWESALNAAADSGRFILTFWTVATPNAATLVRLVPPMEVVPEVALYRALNCKCQPIVWPGRAWRLWQESVTPGISPVVAEAVPEDDTFRLGPLTVLGKKTWVWNSQASRGWAYLTSHIHRESMIVQVPQGRFTLGLIRGHARISFRFDRDTVRIVDRLSYFGSLTTNVPLAHSVELDRALERVASSRIYADAEAAWHRALATSTDPMGWHRDAHWTDARIPTSPQPSWRGWSLTVIVHFTVRDDGVLE